MTSKQRAYLRSLSNKIDPIFQVGKSGITDILVKQIDEAIEARELIKIHVLEAAPMSKKEIAEELALKLNAVLVQIMGSKITLYRAKKKDPKIILPKETKRQ